MKQITTRTCPNCNNLIIYKTVGHRNDAEKHKRVCRKCGYKTGKWIHNPNTICGICKKPIYKIPSRLDGNTFCSIACRNKFYSKENSFMWKGGSIASRSRSEGKDKERRWKKKIKAIKFLGGNCSNCGYDKCMDAIDFHHKDALEKNDTLKNLWNQKWETIETEIKKCVLLCSNCHREHHWKERQKYD